MTDTTVLHEALERGIGPGPAGPDLETVLRDGRRLVRRRRASAVVATLALAAVTGAGALVLDGFGSPTATPVAPASGGPDPSGGRLDETLHGREQVWAVTGRHPAGERGLSLEQDGSIAFPPGVVVVRRVDDALHRAPAEESVAYVVREHSKDVWYLSRVRATGPVTSEGSVVTGVPGVDAATFEDWIAAQGPA
jgi:hypothetical protein